MRGYGNPSEIIPLVERAGDASVCACKPRRSSFNLQQAHNFDSADKSLEITREQAVVQTHATSSKDSPRLTADLPTIHKFAGQL
jgi:hypothetical protein